MAATTQSRADKEALRAKRRTLGGELKNWTLKVPGLHDGQALVCREHRKPDPACESCCCVLYRADRAREIRTEIRALTAQINGTSTAEPATRQAVVVTGRGEQLVMFV